MLPGETSALRKARGAFFTPAPVASFVTRWALREADDKILEPSCGEAAFLHAAGDLGHQGPLHGVEIHAASAAEAERTLRSEGIQASIRAADFFTLDADGSYDAVVGNPPYIRYQDFSGEARGASRRAALAAGVPLTQLASSWAAFTVLSALHLRVGGRMGLVLPAELLTVNYAAEVRRFLMERFESVRLVLFVERVFPGVQEEVVLLLADGYDPTGASGTDHCELVQVQNGDALDALDRDAFTRWAPSSRDAKWTGGMVHSATHTIYRTVTASEHFTTLEHWGRTKLGMVTGANKFFALTPARVKQLGLADSDVIPLSPPGSSHLRRLTFSESARTAMGEDDQAIWLFRPAGDPSPAGRKLIRAGEAAGIQDAYKCRVRTPWWRVPLMPPADLLLTYMNAQTAQLASNRAHVHHLNSVHGVYLEPEHKRLGMDLLPLAALNSITLLGAETVGRAYGGGMLKLEPREASRWPMPTPELVAAVSAELTAIRRPVTRALERGDLTAAAHLVDKVLLTEGTGLDNDDLALVREAVTDLGARRKARGKENRRG